MPSRPPSCQTSCRLGSSPSSWLLPPPLPLTCRYLLLRPKEVVAANPDARRADSDHTVMRPPRRPDGTRRTPTTSSAPCRFLVALDRSDPSPASPGADVGGGEPSQSRRRRGRHALGPSGDGGSPGADVGRGEPSPGADVGRGEPRCVRDPCDHHLQPDAQLLLERRELADFRRGELEAKQQHR
jgi:hypothetical protein